MQSLAEYNSAIQQIKNLRYEEDEDLCLAGSTVPNVDRTLEQFRSAIAVRSTWVSSLAARRERKHLGAWRG